jgi:1-acyl-sn-glycerol-3-phosphate acyltransferase
MNSETVQAQCSATLRSGERCTLLAVDSTEFCQVHAPARPARDATGEATTNEERRQELAAELDDLIDRVSASAPEFEPPPFSVKRITALLEEILQMLPETMRLDVLKRMRSAVDQEWLDADTWKGVWWMLNYTIQYYSDLVKRRGTGEYETDDWGLDWEFVDAIRPVMTFLYKAYWRVETAGLENVPVEGRALLVANHSGQVPWDGMMVGTALLNEHPAGRLVRGLYASLFPALPFVSSMVDKLGQTLATVENGKRLLENEELVVVFPEGYKGLGKPFKDRYRLARFGRGGFARMALHTQAPIIPVSVVGAEETNPALFKLPIGDAGSAIPYLPVTVTFPWLGLLGFLPLPTKWYIDFGAPIAVDGYGDQAAENLILVSQLTDHVRNTVQEMLYARLAQRRSVFFG